MKILIIGSKGQLGSDCCTLFAKDNDTFGCDIPTIDITDKKSVSDHFATQKPDVIINSAAYTAVDGCESEQKLSWKVNAVGPELIAQEADKTGARLIHISTDYVFDGNKSAPNPYLESDKPNPLSQYGRSKLAGELAVQQYCANHVILRTAWLYSSNGKNFLKTMLKLAVNNPDQELKVVDDQYGSLTWSNTLAMQIKTLLDSDLTGVFHATSEGHSTWYEAATYFLNKMGVPYSMRPCTTEDYPTPAHRPANSILKNQRLIEAGLSKFGHWQEHVDQFVEKHRELLLEEARTESMK